MRKTFLRRYRIKYQMKYFQFILITKATTPREYTAIIGVPVSTLNEIPNGLVGREFEAENFQKFVAKGEMPNAVMNTWIDIWNRDEELNRKYTYDFEVYGENSQKGQDSEVEIYIATK
ncbi:GyrI-like domain-containing protein [Riemerella anatipestifer]|uniref:GyrI-like domain-containing protein n=1 Tax=Riemerella anatipestifer TaxID=34085 RepID=UPI0021B0A89D|nr:effector binding domain-containing protein [Riemerella anatipestifer]MCT6762008.1 effector binding domain-containing protein [Riemerella anatipestifer]MDR7715849.1 effector binding domain-containing protein [Riemerella anatipestifer]MDR7757457.1 effector binding domain-containing protein [Riemerella anatipestifer]MDR7761563.1 effector binding domain-containing protein [Riemerella anatipestifer]